MNREPRRQRTYFILLLVTAFALLTIDYHSDGANSPLHPLEKAVAGVVGPGEKAVAGLVKPLTDQVHFGKQPDQVAELQKKLDAALSLSETAQNDHRIVAQLDALLGWPPYYVDKMIPARVVATGDTLSNGKTVTIDAGTIDGLHINMTVVTGKGLIGNIIEADRETSTVQLLIDPAITVGVTNSRTNTAGTVSGGADGNLDLTQYNQTSDIRVNDFLVTRGSDNNEPYVPDVPVGKVIRIVNAPGSATHQAIVQPFASFDGLDLVGVIVPPKTRNPHKFFIAPITPNPTTTTPPAASATPTTTPPASINPLVAASGTPASGAPTSGTSTSGAPKTGSTTTRTSSPATTTPPPPTTTPPPKTTGTPTGKATSKAPTSKPATPTSKAPTSKPGKTPSKTPNPPATHTTTVPPAPTTTPPPANASQP